MKLGGFGVAIQLGESGLVAGGKQCPHVYCSVHAIGIRRDLFMLQVNLAKVFLFCNIGNKSSCCAIYQCVCGGGGGGGGLCVCERDILV